MREEDLPEFEAQVAYNTYDGILRQIGSAAVSPDSVIYKNGRVLHETLPHAGLSAYYQYRHLSKKLFFSPKIRLAGGKKYLLVTDNWSSGHFHWIADVLPKLFLIREMAREFILLLPDIPYIRTIGLESLNLLGLDFEDIVLMRQDGFYKAGDLYFIPRISQSGHFNVELMSQLSAVLRKDLVPGKKKIYISRAKAPCRKVLNEEAFTSLLKGHGFEVLVGEDYSLKEQATIFSGAETLVGMHGAGLANCIFMPDSSKVTELRKKENGPHNVGYWHLADTLGKRYFYFNGTPDSDLPLVGRGCNLTIDISRFESEILSRLD
jgi:capsular polysaccharide biosynthesis protein